uniref:Uncharacterized protein n=1 Tax=Strigamia maritima TaxID=126957 RepID=T1ITE9_STRMM
MATMMEENKQNDPLDVAELIKNLTENGIKIDVDNKTISCQITDEEHFISELQSDLHNKQIIIAEKCQKYRNDEDEVKKLGNRCQTAEHQLTELHQMMGVLQGVVSEKEKNLTLVKTSRDKMKKRQETVLATHRQKWEAFRNFYEGMPESQNYFRLKSELIIAEEDMKLLKKTHQDLEDEYKTLDKSLIDELCKRIFEIATSKCETIRTEKMIHDIIRANKNRKEEEKLKKFQFVSPFPKMGFRAQFRSVLPVSPLTRFSVPAISSLAPPSPATRDESTVRNMEKPLRENEFCAPQLIPDTPIEDVNGTPDKYCEEAPFSQMIEPSSTPQFLSTNSNNSQENETHFPFGPSSSDTPTGQSLPFDFDEPLSSPLGFPFDFNERPTGPIRFQSTPEEQPASSGFLSMFD